MHKYFSAIYRQKYDLHFQSFLGKPAEKEKKNSKKRKIDSSPKQEGKKAKRAERKWQDKVIPEDQPLLISGKFLTASNVVYRGLRSDFVIVVVVVLLCPTMLNFCLISPCLVMFDDVSLLEGLYEGL